MNICKCNNCGVPLWDNNPQVAAVEIVGKLPFNVYNMKYDDGHVCPNCNTDEYLTDLSPDEILPDAYYRLADNQTGGYLATATNAIGLQQWADDFREYYCSDLCDDDSDMVEKLNALSPQEVIAVAYEAGFQLQMSQYPFETETATKIPLRLVEKFWPTFDEGIAVQLTNGVVWFSYNELTNKDGVLTGTFYQ